MSTGRNSSPVGKRNISLWRIQGEHVRLRSCPLDPYRVTPKDMEGVDHGRLPRVMKLLLSRLFRFVAKGGLRECPKDFGITLTSSGMSGEEKHGMPRKIS